MTKQAAATPTTILIVDDEAQSLKYFARVFAPDFEVLTCTSASEAEALFESRDGGISIIVSDQRMPVTTGVTLLSRIKQRWPSTIRVLTTAYADTESLTASINEAGVHRYVSKPWDLDHLRRTLDEAAEAYGRHASVAPGRPDLPPLVGALAHELATPLLSIEMASQSIFEAVKDQSESKPSAERARSLDHIARVALRIGEDAARTRRLARSLAELSREVDQRTNFKRVAAAQCVRFAVEAFPYQPGERGAVALDLADDFAFLGTDVLMGAVMTNLLSNALEAIRRQDERRVTVSLRRDPSGNQIIVADSGPGADVRIGESSFRPFDRARDGGTGLGLSICAWIVRAFGGDLRLTRAHPTGTEVIITLPLAQPQAAER